MELAIVGLGRMGGNMARRLARAGLAPGLWDRDAETVRALAEEIGGRALKGPEDVPRALAPPRVVWLMLPAGEVTGEHVARLAAILEPGDVIVDGANSDYRDSMRRAEQAAAHGVALVDAGVSGGVWGLENGYTLMLGGTDRAVATLAPALAALAPAPDRGWLHCGPSGAGHFVKMVHNGVEYGMMQALAEGFALLEGRRDLGIDLAAVAETWRHGSVVRSWLLDLTAGVLAEDATLDGVAPEVADSGEGRWTVRESLDQGTPAPVIATALMERLASQGRADFGRRLLARMRQAFGGHAVRREE